jgi:radical SAM protein (TIGR01212 family)
MNEPFFSFREFLKEKFPGGRVLKIPIAAGLSCPNRDGTLSRRGCIFCDRYASGPIRTAAWPIERQIEGFIGRHPGQRYIAYFQSHCNTTGPVAELKRKYEAVFKYKDIVGLFVATRPDAIAPPVYALLQETGRRTYLAVELGLQSSHDRSLVLLNRNHTYAQFRATFQALKALGLDVVVHLIVGVPGETVADMRATVAAMNALRPAGVKLHLFHVLRGTELHARHVHAPYPLLSREEYTDIVVDLLERLDPRIVIHRLSAEREREMFIAPLWALEKAAVWRSVRDKMCARGTRQGDFAEAG